MASSFLELSVLHPAQGLVVRQYDRDRPAVFLPKAAHSYLATPHTATRRACLDALTQQRPEELAEAA
jgi:hypothetical protein